MKKFFTIYLCALCLAPILADAGSCNDTNHPANCVTCVQNGGHHWDDLGNNGNGLCSICADTEFHATCTDANDCDEDCTPVGRPEHFRNNAGTGQIPCPTDNDSDPLSSSVAYNFIDQCGNNTCDDTSKLIHTFNGTNHIYYCGNCGNATAEVMEGSSVLYQCDCEGIFANHMYGSLIDGGKRKECECPRNSANAGFYHHTQGCRCGSNGQDSQPFAHINNDITTYECCPGHSTYDSSKGDCVCNVQFAKITRDANNNHKLTECECITGTVYTGDSCKCHANRYVTFDNNSNPNVNWGETSLYLSLCTICPNNSSTDTSDNYPRFCKCNSGYYQDAPSSTSNKTPTCHQCPTQTTTPDPGSVGPKSCRLTTETNFSISNTHTKSMRLIPQGATILPIYTNPYTTNNNNTQSQYTH